jgi:hypothetical protein
MTKPQNPAIYPPSPPTVTYPPSSSPASQPFFSVGQASQSVYVPLLKGSTVKIIVPPGGFAGFAQQTPATQQLFAKAGRKGGKRSAATRKRRKTKAKAKASPRRKRKTARAKRPARLVKGSAAAKRYMASIRRKKKR